MAEARAIAELADDSFTPDKVARRARLSRPAASRGFERPYGWAWLLLPSPRSVAARRSRLGGASWSRWPAPSPSGCATISRMLTYPIRVGTHFNTAFALILALEWAEQFDQPLAERDPRAGARLVRQRPRLPGVGAGRRRVPLAGADRGAVHGARACRAANSTAGSAASCRAWPSASRRPCSCRRRQRPQRRQDRPSRRAQPQPRLVLAKRSRRCCRRRSAQLADDTAEEHLDAAMPHVAGDYMGEHWLASFALLALLS